jgi:hypothetical protein
VTKICTKCKIEKDIDSFCKNKNYKDGYGNWCKKCQNEYNKEHYQKNKQHKKEISAKWHRKNKDHKRGLGQKWYKEHKNHCKEKQVVWCKKNKEYKKERSEKYYQDNIEHIKEQHAEYDKKNRQKINERRKKRTKEDINYRLAIGLRSRLNAAIKGNYKSGSAIKDLGCTIPELKLYLESLFQSGMSWENWGRGHGKWNIDHIIPLSSFDLTDREQFLKANHYINLQPLWAIDNIKKSNKIGNIL